MNKKTVTVSGVYKDFNYSSSRSTTLKSLFMSLHKKETSNQNIQHALKNINFEIEDGEFFGIVGRNGSGKSTLLKIIAGIYQPSKGTVNVKGKLVPFIELGVGFNPELTGKENVFMNGALLGFNVKEVEAFYDEVVEFAELDKFMDKKLKNYSSGMQVRLAFSMAIRAKADVLLVDEVLAVGDADFQRKCFNYFRKLKRDKKTVVFVSHDMNSVKEYCDRAILIDKSEIVASGNAEKIATMYTRMFNDESKNISNTEGSNRWGTGKISYTSVSVTTTDGKINIKLKAKAKEDIEDPNFGFSIRNSSGQVITGTNSHLKKIKLAKIKKNETCLLNWEIPNIFNDGDYTLDLAIVDFDGTTWDWWDGAEGFAVRKEDKNPYLVNPDVRLEMKALN